MPIKVGDKLPEGTLNESLEFDGSGCPMPPKPVNVLEAKIGRAHV